MWSRRQARHIGMWAREHARHVGTWARKHARHDSTWARKHVRHVGTWARKHAKHVGTQCSRLDCLTINCSSSLRLVTKENISIEETVSFRLGCICGTRKHSSCLVTFTFLIHVHNSSFLFFFFFFDWLSLGTTWRLASGVVKEVSRVLAACVISSLNHSLNFLCRPRQHFPHHLIKHVFFHY